MTCETVLSTINGREYTYTQLSATKSLLLKFKIAGFISASAKDIAAGMGKNDKEQLEYFLSAISIVFKENRPDEILSIIKEIFEPAFVSGERIDIDKHYGGNLSEMYKALFWILKEEYGSFLEDALSTL